MIPGATVGDTVLRVSDVSLRRGDTRVLERVSFEVVDRIREGAVTGQVVSLLGPSGIGKTSLLRVLAGLEQPERGEVSGPEGGKLDARTVGLVFQHCPLLAHRTIEGNLVVAGRMGGLDEPRAKRRARELMERVGIEERASYYPAQLSGGQRQRAAVAQPPSLHVFGSGGISSYTHHDAATNGTSTLAAEGNFAANKPMRIGLGTGNERPWGSAEVNVAFNVPVGPAYDAQLEGHRVEAGTAGRADNPIRLDLSTRARGVVNVGVGSEVNLSPSLSVLGGVSTDFSTVLKGALLSDPMSYFPSRTQKVAASFGVGSHGVGGDLYFGGELGYAWGERLADNAYQLPPRLETTPYESYSLLVVIAGTTSFKAIARAVTDLSDAVDPAKK